MSTVETNYHHDGTIREKYNVVSGSDNVKVAAGYKSNVIGFGWTNGVYVSMEELSKKGGSDAFQPATSQKTTVAQPSADAAH